MKVAAITGASGGIGRATAQLLADEYRVYDLSRSGTDSGNIVHIDADVTNEESLSAAFSRIRAREGRLDLLICNAGIGIAAAAEFTDAAAAGHQMNVNFFGVYLACKHAMPLLRETGGRIVAVSSAAAEFPIPFQSFYSASKAAVNTFICALRNEVRAFGVSVCAVMPGDTKTGFTDAVVVVTRYFGGILLGKGGLVRAYTAAAKGACENGNIITYTEYTEFEVKCSYSDHEKIKYECSESKATLHSIIVETDNTTKKCVNIKRYNIPNI